MSWIAVGVGGTMAYMNARNNQAAKKRDAANMQANAAAIQYSPWTGMKPQMMGASAGTDNGTAMLTGGLQGFMAGQSIKNAMAKSPSTPDPVQDVSKTPSAPPPEAQAAVDRSQQIQGINSQGNIVSPDAAMNTPGSPFKRNFYSNY